jgi:hypothetical protein
VVEPVRDPYSSALSYYIDGPIGESGSEAVLVRIRIPESSSEDQLKTLYLRIETSNLRQSDFVALADLDRSLTPIIVDNLEEYIGNFFGEGTCTTLAALVAGPVSGAGNSDTTSWYRLSPLNFDEEGRVIYGDLEAGREYTFGLVVNTEPCG